MNGGLILRPNVKDQGHWERKYINRFSRMSSSKEDRFTSENDQSDNGSTLHI